MFSPIKLLRMEIPIKEIAKKVGGVVALGKALGLSKGAVSQWKRVPIDRVISVEKLTGFTRQQLRPDVFGKTPELDCDPTRQEAA